MGNRPTLPVLFVYCLALSCCGLAACGRMVSSIDDKFSEFSAARDRDQRRGDELAAEIDGAGQATDDAIAAAKTASPSDDNSQSEGGKKPDQSPAQPKEKSEEKKESAATKEMCIKYRDGTAYSQKYNLAVRSSLASRYEVKNKNCFFQYGVSWRVLPSDARATLSAEFLLLKKTGLPDLACLGSYFFDDNAGYCASSSIL